MGTYYIDPINGSDINPGSQEAPFKTFSAQAIQTGDIWLIKGGSTLNLGNTPIVITQNNVTISGYDLELISGPTYLNLTSQGVAIALYSAPINGYGLPLLPMIPSTYSNMPVLTANPGITRINWSGSGCTVEAIEFSSIGQVNALNSIFYQSTGTNNLITGCTFNGDVADDASTAINISPSGGYSGLTVNGCSFNGGYRGVTYLLATAGVVGQNFVIENNYFENLNGDPVNFSISGSANYTVSNFNNLTITGNFCDSCAGSILVRSGNPDYLDQAITIWSTNVTMTGNIVQNSANRANPGQINPANGLHMAMAISGISGFTVSENYVYNCWTQGALIETQANQNGTVELNFARMAFSATGKDGVGIFIDNRSENVICRRNLIMDCSGFGVPNGNTAGYTGGIAIWNATNCSIYSNIIIRSNIGISYGAALESGNEVFNNTILDCAQAGILEYGSNALASAMIVYNNLIIGSTAQYSAANAATLTVTNDYYSSESTASMADSLDLVLNSLSIPIGIHAGSSLDAQGTPPAGIFEDFNGLYIGAHPAVGAHQVQHRTYH